MTIWNEKYETGNEYLYADDNITYGDDFYTYTTRGIDTIWSKISPLVGFLFIITNLLK